MQTSKWQAFLSEQELIEEYRHLLNGEYLFGNICHDALECLNNYLAILSLMISRKWGGQQKIWSKWQLPTCTACKRFTKILGQKITGNCSQPQNIKNMNNNEESGILRCRFCRHPFASEDAHSSMERSELMSEKRLEIEGHIYYITTVIYDRLPILTAPSFVLPILDSLNFYKFKHKVKLLGYMIMPEHIHLLIWPYGESSISDFMRDYKKFTASRLIRQAEVENRQDLLAAFVKAGEETGRSGNKVWQDSFWDKIIYTEKFLRQKLNYIHRNPIRAGVVDDLDAYPYSSYRNYLHDDNTLIEIDREWSY